MSSQATVIHELSLSPLVGTYITLLLYGATLVQAYQYFSNYEQDSTQMKCQLRFHFGNSTRAYLRVIPGTVPASVVLGFSIAWAVNQFFVRRIYVLSEKNLPLSVLISVLATVRPAIGFAVAAFTAVYPDWVVFRQHTLGLMITGLSLGLVVDCLIAFCVSWQLLKGRNTVFGRTRNIINTLLKYTINTGAILTFFAGAELIGLVASPHSLAFFGLFQIQIQLYANCFLTCLNARKTIRGNATQLMSLSMDGPRFANPATGQIQIETQVTQISTSSDTKGRRKSNMSSLEQGSPSSPTT